ncbi:hypothetical protein K2X33_12220 [bacterium]|nr:hypothetical protein [bacterium]
MQPRKHTSTKAWLAAALLAMPCALSAQPGPPDPVATTTNGIREMGFKLFQTLHENDTTGDPIAISPMSIAEAMTLVTLGSEKETTDELASLYLPAGSQISGKALLLANGVKSLRTQLLDFSAKSRDTFVYTSANSLIGNSNPAIDFQYKPQFAQQARDFYGAEVSAYDFRDPATLPAINKWVASKTNDRIKDLITSLEDRDSAILVNATFTKGKFAIHFDLMEDGEYTTAKGTKVPASFLTKSETMGYTENADAKVFSFNVEADPSDPQAMRSQIALDTIVPTSGDLKDLVKKLSGSTYAAWVASLQKKYIKLTMPAGKVEPKESVKLAKVFQAAPFNILRPFSGKDAQFAPIGSVAGETNLFIGDVLTKTFHEMTPFGFEAAAATAVVMRSLATSAPEAPPVPQVHAIRGPSIQVVRHIPTGTPLFITTYDAPKEYTQDEIADLVAEGHKNSRALSAYTKAGGIWVTYQDGKTVVALTGENGRVLKVLKTL